MQENYCPAESSLRTINGIPIFIAGLDFLFDGKAPLQVRRIRVCKCGAIMSRYNTGRKCALCKSKCRAVGKANGAGESR